MLCTQLHTPAAFKAYLETFPPSIHDALETKYAAPSSEIDFINAPASRLIADQIFVDPAWEQALAMSGTKHAESGKECKVFLYRCRAQVDRISRGPVKLGVM